MLRRIGLVTALLGAVLIAWLGTASPWARGAGAPAQAFSAGRAFEDDKVIAARPHPVGSPANRQVRDYLLARMAALGLRPRVQTARAFEAETFQGTPWISGGAVENIIGVLPGRDPAKPALAVMAHYDSVAGSPGAADDAAGVAAALEIARALKAGPPLERDVVFLMTDGEEAGLLGARAFYASHDPARGHIGAVINMESRGGGGQAAMFQTGADNGAWISLLRRNAVSPISSSLAVFVYEHMPNDTDFTVSRAAGLPGLNFAFIGRQFDYHSPSSTPAALDRGSLQHIGEQVLAVTRAAASAPELPGRASNAVYSQAFGGMIIAYPVWVGWPLLGLAAALLVAGLWRARMAGQLIWLDVAMGAGAAVYLLAWTAALLNLARRASGAGFGWLPQRRLLAAFGTYEAGLVVLIVAAVLLTGVAAAKGRARIVMALAALATGGLSSLFGGFDPLGLGLGVAAAVAALVFVDPIGRAGAWAGVLLTGLTAALALQTLAPAAAPLVVWPLLAGTLAAALSQLASDGKFNSGVLRVLIALLALGWLGVYLHGVAEGLDLPALLAVFAWLGAIVAWPLAQPRDPDSGGLRWPLIVMIVGVALIGLVRLHAPWSARHPRATEVVYVADQTDGTFWRASLTPDMDDWTRSALAGDGGTLARRRLIPLSSRPLDVARADPIPVDGAIVTLSRRPDGRMELRVRPPPGARILLLTVRAGTALGGLRVNGLAAHGLEQAGDRLGLRWQGDPAGLTLDFQSAGSGSLDADWASITEAWPAAARPLPPRPPSAMAWDLSDSTVMRGGGRLSWRP